MMRRPISVALSVVLLFGATVLVAKSYTPKTNTRAAVKAYVDRAAKEVARHGPSCATFKDKNWMAGDYYVFVIGPDNRLLCHPNASMVGKMNTEIVDANGKKVGAELANVINEAALLAARRGLKGITLAELEEARDKVRWGKERRSLALSEKEKQNTAYHEAGHALLLVLLPHTEPLHKVTIIPRGPSLGSTMWLPEEDKYTNRKNELLASLAVSMGGRVAEEIIFGDITNGARGDIRGATAIARRMVCEWGMSEKMGMVEYGEHEDYVFLGRDISRARDYSEATAEQIDQEVRRLIDDAYQLAKRTLITNRDTLETIAKALLEYETLDGSQIKEILEHGRLINPPPGVGGSPSKKPAPEKPPKQVVAPDVAPPLPGALGGAPA